MVKLKPRPCSSVHSKAAAHIQDRLSVGFVTPPALPAVRDLGSRHPRYGVTTEHYAPVGAALLWTLEQGLGSSFTTDVKAAWSQAYTSLAGAMQRT